MIPDKILKIFNRSIKIVCSNIACYCNDPVSDFTRKRKLHAETLIHFIVQMQSKSLNSELYEYFTDLDSLPTASAEYIQQKLNIILIGASGSGETWISNAFGVNACMERYKVQYTRLPDLFQEIEGAKIEYSAI